MKRTTLLFLALAVSLSIVAQEKIVVSGIEVSGNAKTKRNTIMREVEISAGDTLTVVELDHLVTRSKQNLLNCGIFNFVDTHTKVHDSTADPQHVTVEFEVTERWNLWPTPKLTFADRNFNAWWQNKKISRLSGGIDLIHYNFLGLRHKVTLTCIAGYNQDFGAGYEIPQLGRSKFGFGVSGGYKRNIGIAYATRGDTVQHFVTSDGFAHKSYYAKLQFFYRQTRRDIHTLNLSFDSRLFADTLAKLNPDFALADGKPIRYFSASYIFRHDYRDNRNYPLNGHFLEMEATNIGLADKEPHFAYVKTTFDLYTQLAERLYWASNITFRKANAGEPPYYLAEGFGYEEDFARGFEIYAVDGKDFYLTKHNLKATIVPYRRGEVGMLNDTRFSKFHFALYGNLFFDAAYIPATVLSENSRMQNKLIFGSGLGIDFVTYYDKVIRIEYGINNFGEARFSLHFTAPI